MSAKLCNYCDRPAVRIYPYPRGRFLDAGYLTLCQFHAEYISVNDRGDIQVDDERRQALVDQWSSTEQSEEGKHENPDR